MTVVLAVEHGWQAMRELSLEFARLGARVDVLIRGVVEVDVLAMVTCPEGMQVQAIARPWFRWALCVHCWLASWSQGPLTVVTHRRESPRQERTRVWLDRLGRVARFRLLLLEETSGAIRLMELNGRAVTPAAVVHP